MADYVLEDVSSLMANVSALFDQYETEGRVFEQTNEGADAENLYSMPVAA
ncbi:MAG: hypothetical protein ACJAX5_001963 [Patiriisocius sp.]|jgi:hypothetical protein